MSYNRLFPAISAKTDQPCTSADAPADKMMVRHMLVHIAGNRATWEHLGVHGAVWRVNPDHAEAIFVGGVDKNQADNSHAQEDRLSRAMIKKVSILVRPPPPLSVPLLHV